MDFSLVLYWWILLLIIGALFLPVGMKLFSRFWDKGWIFCKIGGIISLSYLMFVLGRLHFLPFIKESIFVVVGAWLAIQFLVNSIFRKRKNIAFLNLSSVKEEFLRSWKVILGEEIIFLSALTFWSFIRGFQPNIEGLEKFMDFGFVNSILRSKWMPPSDMWFAGESINYYYFGHVQAALLTLLSGLDSLVTYNLMISTIFALTFSGGFSLASNFVYSLKRGRGVAGTGTTKKGDYLRVKSLIVAGLISAFLLALGGNLHAIIFTSIDGASKYWYPDATRFIGYRPNNPNDKTIHEFPSYSFVVADLHGHMNDIPTVLFFVGLLFVFGLSFKEALDKGKKLTSVYYYAIPLGFLLGITYMTNSWDFPIYGLLMGLFSLLILLFANRWLKFGKQITDLMKMLFPIFKTLLILGAVTIAIAVIFSLPFSVSFRPMAQGIAPVRAHTLWWQFLVLWGFWWFLAAIFTVFVAIKFVKSSKELEVADLLIFSALILATILIVIPELIYVKDIYIPEYHRANTMFKLVYQSFMIYAISSGYIFLRVKESLDFKKHLVLGGLFVFLFTIGFSSHMIYPFFAIRGYYGEISLSRYKGLYGMNFLKEMYPNDYDGVVWLRNNILGQPVVLEAVGDSYTIYNRVSAMTGLPTIEGWLVHEWLWRNGYDRPGARAAEVESIYQGEDDERALILLKNYNVRYIFVGDLEREKYSQINEERFLRWGEVVFSSGSTKIYKLNFERLYPGS